MAGIWAKVHVLRRDKGYAIAHTQTCQNIYVRLTYMDFLESLELGDILEIDGLAEPEKGKEHLYPVAVVPRIIGLAPGVVRLKKYEKQPRRRPNTRPRPDAGNPVEWKREQERRADVDGLREVHAVAGN